MNEHPRITREALAAFPQLFVLSLEGSTSPPKQVQENLPTQGHLGIVTMPPGRKREASTSDQPGGWPENELMAMLDPYSKG